MTRELLAAERRDNLLPSAFDLMIEVERKVRDFYLTLRQEVVGGNNRLSEEEQARLRSHYTVMMSPERNPVELAAVIYAKRRKHPAAAMLEEKQAIVLDAGCGYGSESFLFASLGASVIAVDSDPDKIRIAELRRRYYEECLQKPLDISFEVADLDRYTPPATKLSLTWLGSVLAAIEDQGALLRRVHAVTRIGGKIMVSDMNLWNPLFLAGEWWRRSKAAQDNPSFAKAKSFLRMLLRRGRVGAVYYGPDGGSFDDVQFFTPDTLRHLFLSAGFHPSAVHYSGYVPPVLARLGLTPLERKLERVPIISQLGYFYLVIGVKMAG